MEVDYEDQFSAQYRWYYGKTRWNNWIVVYANVDPLYYLVGKVLRSKNVGTMCIHWQR